MSNFAEYIDLDPNQCVSIKVPAGQTIRQFYVGNQGLGEVRVGFSDFSHPGNVSVPQNEVVVAGQVFYRETWQTGTDPNLPGDPKPSWIVICSNNMPIRVRVTFDATGTIASSGN